MHQSRLWVCVSVQSLVVLPNQHTGKAPNATTSGEASPQGTMADRAPADAFTTKPSPPSTPTPAGKKGGRRQAKKKALQPFRKPPPKRSREATAELKKEAKRIKAVPVAKAEPSADAAAAQGARRLQVGGTRLRRRPPFLSTTQPPHRPTPTPHPQQDLPTGPLAYVVELFLGAHSLRRWRHVAQDLLALRSLHPKLRDAVAEARAFERVEAALVREADHLPTGNKVGQWVQGFCRGCVFVAASVAGWGGVVWGGVGSESASPSPVPSRCMIVRMVSWTLAGPLPASLTIPTGSCTDRSRRTQPPPTKYRRRRGGPWARSARPRSCRRSR